MAKLKWNGVQYIGVLGSVHSNNQISEDQEDHQIAEMKCNIESFIYGDALHA